MLPQNTVRWILRFVLFLTSVALHGTQPNIILMMGDDHPWDEVGYNGHPHVITPVLDEMASSGLRFDRFYSASPVCSPTRGSFLTGRHPNRYGVFGANWSMRPEEITMGHILQNAGYRTAHFGKWHVGPVKKESPTSPGAMGFDEWLSHDNFFELDPVMSRNGGPPEKIEGESSEILIDAAIEFIQEGKKHDEPFLILIWFGSPHEPYQVLPEDLALYDDLPQKYAETTVRLTDNDTGRRTTRPRRDVLQERYAEITAMDRAIGKLRDYLQHEGLRENTLLLYCGDNGIPSSGKAASPLRGLKGDLYDGGIRVPGVLEWPKAIKAPRITNLNTTTSDLLPTLAALTGQPLPDRPIDGISLKPLLMGKSMKRPEPIFFWDYDTRAERSIEREPYIDPELQIGTTPLVKMIGGKFTRTFINFHHPVIRESDYGGPRAVLDGQYKLVVDEGGEGVVELFNLAQDPYESQDLSADHPERVETMLKQLNRWQNSVLYSLTGGDYP